VAGSVRGGWTSPTSGLELYGVGVPVAPGVGSAVLVTSGVGVAVATGDPAASPFATMPKRSGCNGFLVAEAGTVSSPSAATPAAIAAERGSGVGSGVAVAVAAARCGTGANTVVPDRVAVSIGGGEGATTSLTASIGVGVIAIKLGLKVEGASGRAASSVRGLGVAPWPVWRTVCARPAIPSTKSAAASTRGALLAIMRILPLASEQPT